MPFYPNQHHIETPIRTRQAIPETPSALFDPLFIDAGEHF